jgi:hypothetical protein
MKRILLYVLLFANTCIAQTNLVTYVGNSGKETFYDVLQITDGTFLVCGYADNLDWVNNSVPKISLANTGGINNAQGTNRYGIILQLSADMQQILRVIHFPQGVVEDVRFIKTNSLPYTPTGDLFISCNTNDTDPNNGGYILAKLDKNFINGIPASLLWKQAVWAKSGPKDYHPWDVTSNGEIYYTSGESHGYDWSAVYCLDVNGSRKVVNNWRTHWLQNGTEWKGTPASSYTGGVDSVNYSGIALKIWGRCELRSWNQADYNTFYTDGNGGYKKGKWPIDVLFSGPCDPNNPTANGPGYTGYSNEACCPVLGVSSLCVDRRDNSLYIGMNMKSNAQNSPDFEPAVVAMDSTGLLRWWSRLYHEVTPAGDTMISLPDQYVDALAIDYDNDKLVVAARAHGNNTENLWEGNTITAAPNAYGFQNSFTGSNGNIHESWLGKLRLNDGVLTNSTYVAELAEGTGGLGTPHADPNLDGWPDPNTGWPDVNTTRLAKNNMKVSSNGSVCILGVGRRTITTANAYQKMVKPYYGGQSAWNSFVRVYDEDFHVPLYSSLIVGQWDTLTQAGGDNTEIFGVYKTAQGVVCVGRQKAANNVAQGNNIPVTNIPAWGVSNPQNEAAILVYYKASNITDPGDSILTVARYEVTKKSPLHLYPNPAGDEVSVQFESDKNEPGTIDVLNIQGEVIKSVNLNFSSGMNFIGVGLSELPNAVYVIRVTVSSLVRYSKLLKGI